ncbi:hypothetical protein ACFQY3_15270 [Paenibacillus farraposensis]
MNTRKGVGLLLAWGFVFLLTIIIHTTDSLSYALRLEACGRAVSDWR